MFKKKSIADYMDSEADEGDDSMASEDMKPEDEGEPDYNRQRMEMLAEKAGIQDLDAFIKLVKAC